VHGGSRVTYENLRTEVHQGERDFIGPISMQDNGRALYLTMNVDGAPAVNVYVVPKQDGDQALSAYFNYAAPVPYGPPPRFADVAQAGVPYQRALPLPAGLYYVVIDNPAGPPSVIPPTLFGDRSAVVNYVIQIGDAP
jgi:hypothetical protein